MQDEKYRPKAGQQWKGKKKRTDEEKKTDIDNMLNFALKKQKEVIDSKSDAEKAAMSTEDLKQLQILAGQAFNKACDNWIS